MNPYIQIIFKAIGLIFESFMEFIDGILASIDDTKGKPLNADFARSSSILTGYNYGFCLTGKSNLTLKDSFTNALIIGGTGTGKSSVTLIPSIYTMNGSFAINDPSGELYSKTSGYLKQKGYQILRLHFSSPSLSSKYNPIQRANTQSDIQKLSSMLVENALGKGQKDPFWTSQAVLLISTLITILKTQKKEYQNLYNVRNLLNQMNANKEGVDALFSQYADENLFAEYKSIIAYDSKLLTSVIATCKSALQIFNDPNVANITNEDNIDFESFRKQKTAIYINNNISYQKYFNVLTSLFFEQFFSVVMNRIPKEDEQPIFFLLDEASSLILQTLSIACANVRKFKSGIMLLIQDYAQLISAYGKSDAEAIRSNCFSKLFFTGQPLDTCKELEQILGKYEYVDEEDKKQKRSLMTADEIRTMPTNRAILICGNNLPIKASLGPYYKSISMQMNSEIPEVTSFNTFHKPLATLALMHKVKSHAEVA